MKELLTSILELDLELLRMIHHDRILILDNLLIVISDITTFVSIGMMLTVLLIYFISRSRRFLVAFFKILSVFLIAAAVTFSIKSMDLRERPFKVHPDIEKLSSGGNSSFPSGHTTEVFAMAFAFSLLFPFKRIIIPLFIWAIIVAYTRIALGVHYPLDVIAGAFTGAIVSILVICMYNYYETKKVSHESK